MGQRRPTRAIIHASHSHQPPRDSGQRPTARSPPSKQRQRPADKALLERAAAASHLNLCAFLVQAAAARAEEILAERSSIRLSKRGRGRIQRSARAPGGRQRPTRPGDAPQAQVQLA
ncbi:MAG TPA: DUF1778 domain-containing protein [Solirubrobacteraceae bacterium]|nr:DUF1778 domain-containing protein [Solirubrobacteraceae bacterium]